MAQPVSQGGIDYQDGGFSSGSGVYPMTGDLAELAARVGAPYRHNREGNVIFIESFENGLAAWRTQGSGAGYEVLITATGYQTGGYSCKLIGGSDLVRHADILRDFPLVTLNKHGVAVFINPSENVEQVIIVLTRYTDTEYYYFAIKYLDSENAIQVRDEDGNYQTVITGVDLTYANSPWVFLKFVVDLATNEYVRLIYNDQEVDISAYSGKTVSFAYYDQTRVLIASYSAAGQNAYTLVDDVVLTYNEPTRE